MAAGELFLVSLLLAWVNGHGVIKLEEIPPTQLTGSAELIRELYRPTPSQNAEAAEKAGQLLLQGKTEEAIALLEPWRGTDEKTDRYLDSYYFILATEQMTEEDFLSQRALRRYSLK